ncbi:hypothetical protein KKF84_18710, partial [Myxococcota bacterium]|nr:hypothetical protein [Myxococcota bacterium]
MKTTLVSTLLIFGQLIGLGACTSRSSTTESCGDNVMDPGEECDGVEFGGKSCAYLGYYGGTLACNDDCTLNIGPCEAQGQCGDDVLQDGEDCEGSVGNATCISLGLNFTGGTLSCGDNCRYDTSQCTGIGFCGDSNWQSSLGESCDGTDVAGLSCSDFDLRGPGLACLPDCSDFDLSVCESNGECGDGVIQDSVAEVCDGTNLGGNECADLGFYGSGLACGAGCMDFDVSACESNGMCGDSVVQSGYGELCDGGNLNGATCITLGHYGPGSVVCDSSCQLDDSACDRCGDGVIQGSRGEECEGTDIGTAACADRYLTQGTVACLDCEFDYAGCWGFAFDSLSVGRLHGCALNGDGFALCWGDDSSGQMGNSTFSASATPVYVLNFSHAVFSTASFSAVRSGGKHTCGMTTTGTAYCWGDMTYGQLGNGIIMVTYSTSPEPVAMPGSVQFANLDSGLYHSCAVDTGGSAWCWGSNSVGQLGAGVATLKLSVPTAVVMPPGVTFATLAAGGAHTCALEPSGSAWCWGDNTMGCLGDGTLVSQLAPAATIMPPSVVFTQISAGSSHTCALDAAGNAWCWGNN